MKKENIGGVPGNVLGMLADLNLKIQHGRITPKQLERFLKKQDPFENVADDILAEWEAFYEAIGYDCGDLSGVRIPENPDDANRAIVMAKGITPQVAYDLCYKHFNKRCWKWTDRNLDEIVKSDRTAENGPYAIRIRDRVEADAELKNLSYDKLKELGIKGVTLAEHLINHLKYFKETGKHLDIQNWTLCSGLLYRDGSVPCVSWRDVDEMGVRRCSPDLALGVLRSRSAVTLVT
jgi:hypothetical protein